jgi:hypothetical protein
MAWVAFNKPDWEYDNAPPDPGVDSPLRPLWLQQTAGIRTWPNGTEIYTRCREVGSGADTMGEINKTYWDAHP